MAGHVVFYVSASQCGRMIQSAETMELMLARSGIAYPKGSVLHNVGPKGLEELDAVWTVGEYAKGQMLLQAEETTSDVWFLLSGLARVAVFTESGREVSMFTFERGDSFGEFSAIDSEPRSASIEALTDCVAARLSGPQFRSILASSHSVSGAFLRLLVGKLRDMTAKVSDFSAHTADERIRGEILRIALAASKGRDIFIIDTPPTQAEIAARVFTNRETVAREMGRMRRLGVIDRVGRRISVPSLAALTEYVKS